MVSIVLVAVGIVIVLVIASLALVVIVIGNRTSCKTWRFLGFLLHSWDIS